MRSHGPWSSCSCALERWWLCGQGVHAARSKGVRMNEKVACAHRLERRKEGIPTCAEVILVLEKSQGYWEKRPVSGGR